MRRLFPLAVLGFALSALVPAAHASVIIYTANLSGPNESPPNASPGVGFAEVDYDTLAHTMRVRVTFSGLLGTTTTSHIHAATPTPGTGTAGVATQTPTFSNFPLNVTSGTYDQTFDTTQASFYNPAYIIANGGTAASAEASLLAAIAAGESYLNIHTTVVPGGEIRGFLLPQGVPEPTSLVLACVGAVAILGYHRFARGRAAS